jgi:hypothetical protein
MVSWLGRTGAELMNLDDKYILVFVRQNMFPDHQMVHSFHLGFLIGRVVDGYCQKRHTLSGHPIVLVFGKPDEAGVIAAGDELRKLGIEFIQWQDPDSKPEHDDFGLTGIVSEPITKTVRNKLPRFVGWSDKNNIHPRNDPACSALTT